METKLHVPAAFSTLPNRARHWQVAALLTCAFASGGASAFIVDGTAADKSAFLNYLLNQSQAAGAAFRYSGDNAGKNGPVELIGEPALVDNFFGSRMVTATNTVGNQLTIHVGRNQPGLFFGAFQLNGATNMIEAGHQTIDLADLLAIPARSAANLEGGTDILLHEVYEAIAGLAQGDFDSSHFNGGYQAENSNRAADGNRGTRVAPPLGAPDTTVVDPVTGAFAFRTAWEIANPNNPANPTRGRLVLRGTLTGGANYSVKNMRFGLVPEGSLEGPFYDASFESMSFEPSPVPVPPALVLMGGALAGLWRMARRQRA